MSLITQVKAREIIDSRGNPTVEAEVHLKNGCFGIASVPSGASTGSREALELRDHDNTRFLGNGVMKSVNIINNKISKYIYGKNAEDQSEIDKTMIELDGTENKAKLGANTILAVSLANAKAAAHSKKIKLYEHIYKLSGNKETLSIPLPMVNIINGGKHANNNIDIQEFMIQPVSAKNIKEAIRICAEIFHNLKKILHSNGMSTAVGDEGGFAPNLSSNTEALEVIIEAVKKSGYKLFSDITLAIDCAASELYKNKKYFLSGENNRIFTSNEFTNFLHDLTKKYPIVSIEDGLHESDLLGFQYHTKLLGNTIQVVGDDLFVTNEKILLKGIKKKIANAILIKYNQVGTLSETLDTIKLAKKYGYKTIISHRSGETEDVTIADLAVGTSAGQIKTGSISRTDRVAKYNRLIRIEEELGDRAIFANIFKK